MEKNRSGKHKFTLYLSDNENRILDAKYKMSNMRSKSTFLRHMIVYGAVYDVDYAYFRNTTICLRRLAEI